MAFCIKNCEACGDVFSGPKEMCLNCIVSEENALRMVYEYLRDYPNVTVSEVSAGTEVKEDLILKFIRQGRIQINDMNPIVGSLAKRKCLLCGRSTQKGDYCSTCLAILKTAIDSGSTSLAERSGIVKDSVHSNYGVI